MNQQTQPFVSTIIPVLNDPQRLQLCLEALENQTYPKHLYEVLVIDNGSDESIEPVVRHFKQAKMLLEPSPGSYTARNKGILHAKGEVLAFTDADCIPQSDWLEKGTAHLLGVPNCGLVGGNVLFSFKNPHRPNAAELYDQFFFLQQEYYLKYEQFAATANVFTYKQVFKQVGLFNSMLKSGGDREWGKRVFAAGYAQSYAADAAICHPARDSVQKLQKKVRRVARATYDLNRHRPNFPLVLLKFILSDLKPPLRIWFKIGNNNRPNDLPYKLEFMTILMWIKLVKAGEKSRLFISEFMGEAIGIKLSRPVNSNRSQPRENA
ncbi:glycosyltransferase [Laspinema olomoucense]|uniref:Glycosyltransferase family 2 protein n=1 Tax=Laspinema olomoucense D3b TaxID=2953688 RepID=A0ABT2N8V7_9CYAN|nr:MULTISPECIES: glycosyltransferase family A protein [unclassified Laspinema]MCT7979121.1 glycosyltransferase family 2 protein [Laspinema sp. D3b]MCT7987866.1 glycosyltransferase family 2 protein [Laspinema sp. D3a]